jgi:hypothetical protein
MDASSGRKKRIRKGTFTGGELFQRQRRQGWRRWMYVVLERLKA